MSPIRMVLPKGRTLDGVVGLLNDSGKTVVANSRHYVPSIDDEELEAKIMKPQNVAPLVERGSYDIGFTGRDWVVETGAEVVEILDLGLDPVRIVAAIPESEDEAEVFRRRLVVATEYTNIAGRFLSDRGCDFLLLRTQGASEAFPPEDADMIIDNTATGRTLKEHRLKIVAEILASSTRFIANPAALADGPEAGEDRGADDALRRRAQRPGEGDARDERAAGQARDDRPDPALHALADGLAALRRGGVRRQGGGEERGGRPADPPPQENGGDRHPGIFLQKGRDMSLIRPCVSRLETYAVSQAPDCVKLNQNESPDDLPPEVKRAVLARLERASPGTGTPARRRAELTRRLAADRRLAVRRGPRRERVQRAHPDHHLVRLRARRSPGHGHARVRHL